jgi:GT2 family glycosyltransferase
MGNTSPTISTSEPMVYVLILNWNGWRDTVECLESVFRNDYSNYKVIICDNDSADQSLEYIKAWAEGHVLVKPTSQDERITSLVLPPIPKPVSYIEYDRATAEAGGNAEDINSQLVLIRTGGNLGFAGGNNIGLRYALAFGDFEYVWLLNNDTVIKTDALSRLVKKIQKHPDAGICGSTLLYYHVPNKVQAAGGGTYNKWIATARHIEAFQPASKRFDEKHIMSRMSYVVGASMLVSKHFLRDIGLMSEDYFLYFEELDWATRAAGKYVFAYSSHSIIYHKEGGSIGTSSKVNDVSYTADYYGVRNRLVFTKKYYPHALPSVLLGLMVAVINRLRRGKLDRIPMIFACIRKYSKIKKVI